MALEAEKEIIKPTSCIPITRRTGQGWVGLFKTAVGVQNISVVPGPQDPDKLRTMGTHRI
jgi:hypothetical protein